MMEQRRHARRFFDLAWLGIGAGGAVDPMVGRLAATRTCELVQRMRKTELIT